MPAGSLNAGLAYSGAHMTLIPEQPFDIEELCRLVRPFQRGDSRISSAWSPKASNRLQGRSYCARWSRASSGHERFTGASGAAGGRGREAHQQGCPGDGVGPHPAKVVLRPPDQYWPRFGVNADAARMRRVRQMVTLRGRDIGRVPLDGSQTQASALGRYDDAPTFFG